ncbi:hypothetical protein ANN_23707 [Periplaneta americana]|uniref:DUF4817 domain-containing protein n=1 Tax=Periplaneta americana TaxID=6978 RepID=A0ABQ8SLT8_PERAM|nr:hypothetical protein ANN_23707 [Periplaneta americana]
MCDPINKWANEEEVSVQLSLVNQFVNQQRARKPGFETGVRRAVNLSNCDIVEAEAMHPEVFVSKCSGLSLEVLGSTYCELDAFSFPNKLGKFRLVYRGSGFAICTTIVVRIRLFRLIVREIQPLSFLIRNKSEKRYLSITEVLNNLIRPKMGEPYTNSEMTDMILIYGETRNNSAAAARIYDERFRARRHPTPKTFVVMERRLRETCRFARVMNNAGRHKSSPRLFQILCPCGFRCFFQPGMAYEDKTTYIQTLVKLRRALRDKRRNINADDVKLLHDNARPNVTASVREKINTFGWEVLQYSPYSPDLAPSHFHLFGLLTKFLADHRFATDAEMQSTVRRWLGYSNRTDFYEQGILKLVPRWEKCVEKLGAYVEK